MAVWPIWIVLYAAMTAGTALRRSVAWRAPFAILCGYVAMRGVMWGLEPLAHMLGAAIVWLIVSIYLGSIGWVKVALCFAMCGLVYPIMQPMGYQIAWFSAPVIVSEFFAILAFLGVGGGLAGISFNYRSADSRNGSGALSVFNRDHVALAQGDNPLGGCGG